jgi:sporulation protein YlmC with PRC-barrel domain
MRKFSIVLSLLVLVTLVLTACGGEETSTNVPASPPPVTADTVTEAPTEVATEAATQEGTATETPGVPVTGEVNPARLSNQLDFTVWSQDGEQIGEVDDIVLDLDNKRVAYVVVGTGGFLDLGERNILVPWDMLELQIGTGETTGGQQNAFVLTGDLEIFRNAPNFDLGNLPEAGQPADDWDVDIRTYWESGGTTGGAGTAVPEMTATGQGTDQATATMEAGQGAATATATAGTGADAGVATATAGTGTGQSTGQGQTLQGVILASNVLGAPITLSPGQGSGSGTDTGQATATVEAGQGAATATPGTGAGAATATATAGTGTGQGVGNIEGTVDDVIGDVGTGEVQYFVIDVTLDEGERLVPVPVGLIGWDANNGAFLLNANPAMLRDAPSFENGQYPDTTASGWNTEINAFWQNNGGGTGTGTGAQATVTPTP